MVDTLQVTSLDLDRWADSTAASTVLPQLIRKLILATSTPDEISFPAGEETRLPGWDGVVSVRKGGGNAFVPEGVSAWELSTEKGVGTKASGDYQKRTKDSEGLDKKHATYVALTLRKWSRKRSWRHDRKSEGIWQDVRAYDAGDLETWLETAPGIQLWLGSLIGKAPRGAEAVQTWWENWRNETTPPLTVEVMTAGRKERVRELQSWISEPESPPTLSVRADTPEEAMAFVACSLASLPDEYAETWLSRAVVVSDPVAWNRMVAQPGPLLLIPMFEDQASVGAAARNRHRVVLPLGREKVGWNVTLDLPPLGRLDLEAALERLEMSPERARRLARTGRGGIQPLRRELGHRPELQGPSWTKGPLAANLLGPLLVGQWQDQNPVDLSVLEQVARRSYSELRHVLLDAERQNDPPVRHTGGLWRFPARKDTWHHLSPLLTPDQLEAFRTTAIDALSAADPRWDLPADRRWMSKVIDKTPTLSDEARSGIVETLALLAFDAVDSSHGRVSRGVVRAVLGEANKDWRRWATLDRNLPDLAEIDPDGFLDALDVSLRSEDSAVLKLFGHDTGSFLSMPAHTALLRALEKLAWSPRYLTRSALALARMARNDPGGRYANRPSESLRNLFLPWFPQTAASLADRLVALDRLQQAEPDTAFELLLSLLPRTSDSAMPAAAPRWQSWKPEGDPKVTQADYSAAIVGTAARLIAASRGCCPRWQALIPLIHTLPEANRSEALRVLRSEIPGFSRDGRELLWHALRDVVNSHRAYSEADWALNPAAVDEIEDQLPLLAPGDPVARAGWLFDKHPKIDEELDWQVREARLEERRRAAILDVLAERGVDGVLSLARDVQDPWCLGLSLGKLPLDSDLEERLLTTEFGPGRTTPEQLAQGFVRGRIETGGDTWLDAAMRRQQELWSTEQIATFYLMMNPAPATWDRVDSEPLDVQAKYWQKLLPFGFGHETEHMRAARAYLSHGAPGNAVKLLSLYARCNSDVESFLVLEALEAASAGDQKTLIGDPHAVIRCLERLEQNLGMPEERLGILEWTLLPLFEALDRTPTCLHRRLERDPLFFVELCRLAFKVEDEDPPALSEAELARARNAYRLLESWHGVPGRNPEGSIVPEALRSWVQQAREGLRISKRIVVGDLRIGRLLSWPTAAPDGSWPHPAVCDVVEEVASPDLEQGFVNGVFNSKGVYSKGFLEGGGRERDIAAGYEAAGLRIQVRWPRMAAALFSLASSFQDWAEREDLEARNREDE